MTRNILTITVLLLCASFGIGQDKKKPSVDDAATKCAPKYVKRTPIPRDLKPTIKKGEKPSRYPPVVAYDVLESGEVVNARIKRSSGISSIDQYVLRWANNNRFNARPGCGTVESSAAVIIHWE
jgi:hypothetical protein